MHLNGQQAVECETKACQLTDWQNGNWVDSLLLRTPKLVKSAKHSNVGEKESISSLPRKRQTTKLG